MKNQWRDGPCLPVVVSMWGRAAKRRVYYHFRTVATEVYLNMSWNNWPEPMNGGFPPVPIIERWRIRTRRYNPIIQMIGRCNNVDVNGQAEAQIFCPGSLNRIWTPKR